MSSTTVDEPVIAPSADLAQLSQDPRFRLPRAISARRLLARLLSDMGVEFTVDGRPTPAFVIMGEDAFLPAVAIQADVLSRSLLGKPFGAVFRESENAVLGVWASVGECTADGSGMLRAALLFQAACEAFGLKQGEAAVCECAPVFRKYRDGLISSPDVVRGGGQ